MLEIKKEIVAIILLALLFALSLYNSYWLTETLDSLVAELELAESAEGEAAALSVKATLARWQELEGYTHVFIRHDETTAATEAFYDLLDALYSGDDTRAGFIALKARLRGIAAVEQLSLRNIF